jgi:competence protein ComFC
VAGRASPLARIWETALDLVFPPRCVSCRAWGAFLCRLCLAGAMRALPPRCWVCWMPSNLEVCGRCRVERPAFSEARSVFAYEDAARDAVHALKFNGVSAVAGVMAEQMASLLERWAPPVDAVVPVPLSVSRLRTRGYNQSELLARSLARATGIPLVRGAAVRARSTPPQARQPDEAARRANVSKSFLPGGKRISGNVLLIDDVLTTGATLDACARVLLGNGADGVVALTFARED